MSERRRSEASRFGRPRAVLAMIDHVLCWQDRIIGEVAVEVDGDWYVPAWVMGDDEAIPIPADWLADLYTTAGGALVSPETRR